MKIFNSNIFFTAKNKCRPLLTTPGYNCKKLAEYKLSTVAGLRVADRIIFHSLKSQKV